MDPRRVEEYCALIWRAALQDRTAEMAADIAHEADHTRQVDSAEFMWRLVQRCRVRALKLRAEARAIRARK
jgi:hypothetical protein